MSRSPSKPSPLLFSWKDTDKSLTRLFLASLATLFGLVLFFVVFRVAYPESRPVSTRPEQIIVLNPDVPAELALIHRAMDRSFALIPSDIRVPAGATSPEAELPHFRPSFEGYELRLHGRTAEQRAATVPHLFVLPEQMLPPLAPPGESPPPSNAKSQLHMAVEGEVAPRQPLATVLNDVPLAEPVRSRFQIAVGPKGQVLLVMPLVHLEDATIEGRLQHAIRSLRFAPSTQPVQFGIVSFHWEGEDSP